MSVVQEAEQPRIESPVERRRFEPSRRDFLAAAAALGASLTLDAGMLARHDLEVVSRTIRIDRLPEAFQGFRIVQISDIHLEEYTEPYFLRLALNRINALRPDLVLLTGDFISMDPLAHTVAIRAAETCALLLPLLTCPQRYAALGNHDNVVGAALVTEILESHGTPVLVNQYIPLERDNQRIWLAGLDDPGAGSPRLDRTLPPATGQEPTLLMCHAPDFVDAIIHDPRGALVDLVLSGHTHGGQIRLPFVGPLVLPPLGQKYVEGLFRFGKTQLYVNRGLGTVGLPFRFNCRPELTLLTLQHA